MKQITKIITTILALLLFIQIVSANQIQDTLQTQEGSQNKKQIGGFPLIFYSDETRIAVGGGVQVMFGGESERFSSTANVEIKKWIDSKVMSGFKAKGVKSFKFPEKDRAKWAQMCEDIPAEWAAEVTAMGYPGWEIVNRYQDICEELGYKWPRRWGVKK